MELFLGNITSPIFPKAIKKTIFVSYSNVILVLRTTFSDIKRFKKRISDSFHGIFQYFLQKLMIERGLMYKNLLTV